MPLTFSHRVRSNADQDLAAFLNELRPQSIESFKFSSHNKHGCETFQALSCHEKSLVELNLNMLSYGTWSRLALLKGCKNLVSLSLRGSGFTLNLEDSSSPLLEAVAWLTGCKKLRNISFAGFSSSVARSVDFMTPILSENSIRLTSFKYDSYNNGDAGRIHQALTSQASLQTLWLKAHLSKNSPETEALVESLCKLVNLTDLRLSESNGSIFDQHILQLARSLPKLQIWETSGYKLTDAIWDELAPLRSLQRLVIGNLSNFTTKGILDFIKNLRSSNKNLELYVPRASTICKISGKEQELIQETIFKKIAGKFELNWSISDV